MAKNITISEGDTSKQFTAKKLKMNLVGGGTTNFVPEDEAIDYVDIKDQTFTDNGTFSPSDFNCDAFGEIVVDVAGGGGDFAYVEAQQKNARTIADGTSSIVSTTYITLEEATQVRFYSTLNFTVALTASDTPATVTVTYLWDDNTPSTPITQTYGAGSQILTVDFLTPILSAGDHVFSMRVGISGGALS